MKPFAKVLACTALLFGSAHLALADNLDGSVELNGGASYDTTHLTFVKPFASNSDTGIFSSFSGGSVNYLLGTVEYMGSLVTTTEAFTITAATGDTLAFYDTYNVAKQTVDPITGNLDLSFDEIGYYTINGGTAMDGYFHLSMAGNSPTGSGGTIRWDGSGGLTSAFVSDTPEPTPLILLGTGLLGMAGVATMGRRRGAAAL